MLNKQVYLFLFFILMSCSAFSQQTRDTSNPAYDQARSDYRTYLDQLKVLNEQYKEVTGELKSIIQDEGLPVWDENAGGVNFVKGNVLMNSQNDVDIKETDSKMIVALELPGLKKETLRVTIQDSKVLKISGEKKQHAESIERLINLPSLAQEKGQTAAYEDGVLTVHILKVLQRTKEVAVPVS